MRCDYEGCSETGGKFHLRGGKWYCHYHDGPAIIRDGTHILWPLVTTHLTGDGKTIVIENLRQLRRAENTYGAQSVAWNQNHSNWEP